MAKQRKAPKRNSTSGTNTDALKRRRSLRQLAANRTAALAFVLLGLAISIACWELGSGFFRPVPQQGVFKEEAWVRVGATSMPLTLAREQTGALLPQTFNSAHAPRRWLPYSETVTLKRIRQCLQDFHGNEFVATLETYFQNRLYLGRVEKTANGSFAINKRHDGYAEIQGQKVFAIFYDENGSNFSPLQVSTFSYHTDGRREEGMLFLPSFEISEPFYCARVIHELGHGYTDLFLQAQSSIASRENPLWAQEEVEMHLLEANVLNLWTKGEYFKRVRTLLNAHQFTGIQNLLRRVSLTDILYLNELFPEALQGESAVRLGSFVTTLKLFWVKEQGGSAEDMATVFHEK